YTLRVEPKEPWNVTFGNDGGACIAVQAYHDGVTAGPAAGSVPYYLLDDATVIVGIYQHVRERAPVRVGFLVGFATTDQDGRPSMLYNSMELSENANPLSGEGLTRLTTHARDYLKAYAQAAGFRRVAMGTHNYNTATNHLPPEALVTPDYAREELEKLPDIIETGFFSEVLDKGRSIKGDWAWLA
ncbi:MAG: hypothetical protein ABIH41_05960, partial [Nanoarchaeota archaeon]